MRILYLNNYHYIRGGSERVFFAEMEVARTHGDQVYSFARAHPQDLPSELAGFFPPDIQTESISLSWPSFKNAGEVLYSRNAKRALGKALESSSPELAHAHNIYGRLTASVLDLLEERHIPTVMTLHDYKLMCPSYRFMYDGHICEDCKGGRFYMAVLNRCHKASVLASGLYALEAYLTSLSRTYRKKLRCLISPSIFLRDKLVEYGWPREQIVHIPNFLDMAGFTPQYSPGKYFLYQGRLSPEKGIQTLISAFMGIRDHDTALYVVGEGPLRDELERSASPDPRIRFTGYLSGEQLYDVTKGALAVVAPSEWYENAPISVLEALSLGKPVIGARIGGIPEMIEDGVDGCLFDPGSREDLVDKLKRLLKAPERSIMDMGRAAREKAERKYDAETHYARLSELYRRVLQGAR